MVAAAARAVGQVSAAFGARVAFEASALEAAAVPRVECQYRRE